MARLTPSAAAEISEAANRTRAARSKLDSGDVLIVGLGANTELYNPSSGTFTLAAGLNATRTDHRTVLLSNGNVLTTGGYDGNGGNIGYLSSAELFH